MKQEDISKLIIGVIEFLSVSQKLGIAIPDIKKELEMTGTISPHTFNHLGFGVLEQSTGSHEKILVAREYNELISPFIDKKKK